MYERNLDTLASIASYFILNKNEKKLEHYR